MLQKSKPKDKSRNLINAAASGASAPSAELHSVVTEVAVHMHGVYVMKSSEPKSLRNVFLRLFREQGPELKSGKEGILQQASDLLSRKVTEKEYLQVCNLRRDLQTSGVFWTVSVRHERAHSGTETREVMEFIRQKMPDCNLGGSSHDPESSGVRYTSASSNRSTDS